MTLENLNKPIIKLLKNKKTKVLHKTTDIY